MKEILTKNLSLEERLFIEKYLKENLSGVTISQLLNRSRTTIEQEIRINGGKALYNAKEAQMRTDMKKESARQKKLFLVDEEKIKQINKMKDEGFSIHRISKGIGCSPSTIRRILINLGIHIKKQNYTSFIERLEAAEEHIILIFELIKEMKNDTKNT